MYGRINVVNILFLIVLFSMNPIIIAYYFNHNYYLNGVFISFIILAFIFFIIKRNFVIMLSKSLRFLIVLHTLIMINTIILYQKISHELLFFSLFISLFILSSILIKDVDSFLIKIVFFIKILLIMNLIVFICVNIFKMPYSQIILNINGEYIRHHFMFMGFVLDHSEYLWAWSFHRTHSFFTEPAQFGTFLALIIVILKINNYKGSYKLFWLSGFFSFSMMFYIFFLMCVFFSIYKYIRAYHIILLLFLLQILISYILLNYINFEEFSSVVNGYVDPTNSFLMKAGSINHRLEFFYNNIILGLFHPFGVGYADNIDLKLFFDENVPIGIRSATGLAGNFFAFGGITLLIFYFVVLKKIEDKFINEPYSINYLKSGLVLISLLSTSSFFSPFIAVLLGVTYKKFNKKGNLDK